MRLHCAFLVALHGFGLIDSFSIVGRPIFSAARQTQQSTTARFMGTGKGFGEPTKKKTASPSTDVKPGDSADLSDIQPKTTTAVATLTSSSPPEQQSLNAGQVALEKMRRQKAEEQEAQLRSVRDLILQDELAKETPAVIPEKVAQRMGKRMLPFVGLPLFTAMGTFVGFWYFATYKNMEFQPAAVATTTVFLLFVGLLGITYSLLSASWDPDREGDLLGVDEFKTNVENIRAGLSRSRENALLREKMAEVGSDEIKAALNELERKEKVELKRTQSLASKLQDELE